MQPGVNLLTCWFAGESTSVTCRDLDELEMARRAFERIGLAVGGVFLAWATALFGAAVWCVGRKEC